MLIYVDPCKWPTWVLLCERARGISFICVALSAHTFMPVDAFDFDWEAFWISTCSIFEFSLHNLCSASSLSCSFEVSVSELLQGESGATVHILSVALTQATLSFYTHLSLYYFSSCPLLPALRKPKHRVANTVGNNSKWFDPTFPRDFKIWCLSDPSAQWCLYLQSHWKKQQLPTPLRCPALVPIKHIKCQRWMSVDISRDESSTGRWWVWFTWLEAIHKRPALESVRSFIGLVWLLQAMNAETLLQ